MSVCGITQHPGFPDAGEGVCCYGAAVDGPEACTCWRPEYDLEQQPVDDTQRQALAVGFPPATRERMCGDCAYRPGSPEKTDEHSADQLESHAASSRFWCHQGIRRPARWRHPSGAVVDGDTADYRPPIHDGVPYRADGTPAELCAGWDARRRALAARTDG